MVSGVVMHCVMIDCVVFCMCSGDVCCVGKGLCIMCYDVSYYVLLCFVTFWRGVQCYVVLCCDAMRCVVLFSGVVCNVVGVACCALCRAA